MYVVDVHLGLYRAPAQVPVRVDIGNAARTHRADLRQVRSRYWRHIHHSSPAEPGPGDASLLGSKGRDLGEADVVARRVRVENSSAASWSWTKNCEWAILIIPNPRE